MPDHGQWVVGGGHVFRAATYIGDLETVTSTMVTSLGCPINPLRWSLWSQPSTLLGDRPCNEGIQTSPGLRPRVPPVGRRCVRSVLVTAPLTPEPSATSRAVPPPLTVAAAVVGVEALLLVGYAVVLLPAVTSARVVMGVTTPVFFILYGVALAFCAWKLRALHSWARSPLVLAQLIQLGVAWSFRGGPSTGVAVGLAVLSLVALAGIFHPASLEALADRPDDR